MGFRTLYITDLDGTLLNRQSVVSDYTAATLARLTNEGAMITAATARTPATVDPLLSRCRLRVPAVVLTGAALWNFEQQRYVNPVFMSGQLYDKVLDVFARHSYMPFVYHLTDDEMTVFHTAGMNSGEQAFYEQRSRLALKKFVFGELPRDEMRHRVILLFGTGPAKEIYAVADELKNMGDCSVSAYPDIFDPDLALIEVFAPGVNKAAAIERLRLSSGAERVVVFGDNLNDLPMMRSADLSVAVANGLDEVRRAADIVIGSNEDDAVARFIDYDFKTA